MYIKKVEILCEHYNSLEESRTHYAPIGKYRLLYEDGRSEIKSFILNEELDNADSVEMVGAFFNEIE